jgi:hypothetical protein
MQILSEFEGRRNENGLKKFVECRHQISGENVLKFPCERLFIDRSRLRRLCLCGANGRMRRCCQWHRSGFVNRFGNGGPLTSRSAVKWPQYSNWLAASSSAPLWPIVSIEFQSQICSFVFNSFGAEMINIFPSARP